jgi:hypothetical protein
MLLDPIDATGLRSGHAMRGSHDAMARWHQLRRLQEFCTELTLSLAEMEHGHCFGSHISAVETVWNQRFPLFKVITNYH